MDDGLELDSLPVPPVSDYKIDATVPAYDHVELVAAQGESIEGYEAFERQVEHPLAKKSKRICASKVTQVCMNICLACLSSCEL